MLESLSTIERLIEERQSALFEIERILFTKRYQLISKHQDLLAVHSIAIIYSIWEGFVQNAFNIYLDQLNKFEIECDNINDSLYLYSLEKNFKQFKNYPQNATSKIRFITTLKEYLLTNRLVLVSGINTQSNVNFDQLNSILKSFCLEPFPEYWHIYSYPSPSLKDTMKTFLRYRNGVAHGGDITSEDKVVHDVFVKYKLLVLNLMYEIHYKMEYGLKHKTYLKNI